MSDSTEKFYNDLADEYHLIFEDWDASMKRQSNVLDRMIGSFFNQPRRNLKLLDCSCGIGTQAIGLALLGYRVHATDLSQASVSRAQREAKRLDADLTFGVADFRSLQQTEGRYDVVISCDNSLPHLLNDNDFRQALSSIREKLVDGGLFLSSIRDYDRLLQEKPGATLPTVYEDESGKRVVFQVWFWENNSNIYTLEHFIIRKYGEEWRTSSRSAKYKAILRSEFSAFLLLEGFSDIIWHLPEETGYYQPLVTGRRT